MNSHPDYGLTDELRIKSVRDAKAMSVKKAAETNRVSIASIYNWRKALEQSNEQL
jgi:transposase